VYVCHSIRLLSHFSLFPSFVIDTRLIPPLNTYLSRLVGQLGGGPAAVAMADGDLDEGGRQGCCVSRIMTDGAERQE